MKKLLKGLLAGVSIGITLGVTKTFVETNSRLMRYGEPLIEIEPSHRVKSSKEHIREAEDAAVMHFYKAFKRNGSEAFLKDKLLFIKDENTFESYSAKEKEEIYARICAIMAAIKYLGKPETLYEYGVEDNKWTWIVDTTRLNIVWGLRMRGRE